MKFQLYTRRNLLGQRRWHWRLRARNGRIVASGETFETRRAALDSIELVRLAHRARFEEL